MAYTMWDIVLMRFFMKMICNIKSKERTTQCSHQYKVSRGSIYVTLPLQEERFQLNLVTEIAKEQSYYDVMRRSILYQIVVMNYITKFNLWIVMLWLI